MGMVCVCAVLMPYTSTVLAWTVQYTVDCLQKEVPWSSCPPEAENTTCPDELSPSEYYFMYVSSPSLHFPFLVVIHLLCLCTLWSMALSSCLSVLSLQIILLSIPN